MVNDSGSMINDWLSKANDYPSTTNDSHSMADNYLSPVILSEAKDDKRESTAQWHPTISKFIDEKGREQLKLAAPKS